MNSSTMYRGSRPWALAVAIAAGVLAEGCGDGSSNANTNDAAPAIDASSGDAGSGSDSGVYTGPTGGLRFVHAAPQAGELDIYIKDQLSPLFTSIGYGTTTGLVQAPVGTYRLVIRPAGAVTTARDYVSEPVTVTEGGAFTVLGAGVVTDDSTTTPRPEIAFRTTVLPDVFSTPEPGKAHVRVVNAMYSVSAGIAVDLLADGAIDIASLAPFALSAPNGLAVPAGADLAFNVQTVATTSPDVASVAVGSFTVPAAMLGDGSDVYVVVSGQNNVPTRDPRGAIAFAIAAGKASAAVRPDPTLFLLNVSPDAGSVDAYLDSQKQFTGIGFGAVKSTAVRPNITGLTLQVRAAASAADSPALGEFSTGRLDGGQQYLAIVYGLARDTTGAAPLSLSVLRNDMVNITNQDAATGILRVVNATVGAGAIDGVRFNSVAPLVATPVVDFLALPVGGASPAQGTAIDTRTGLLIPGIRPSVDPSQAVLFGSAGGMTPLDQWFGVFAGAWSPTGSQLPATFIAVKTASNKDWSTTSFQLQPNSLVVSPMTANLIVGHAQQYTATGLFGNGTSRDITNSVTWTPGTLTIASPSTTLLGLVTAKGAGTTTITAATNAAPTLRVTSTLTVRAVAAPAVLATQLSDGASGVSTITAVSVTFDRPIAAGSLTAQTAAGGCSGGLQLSADNFATCVGFATAAPTLSADTTVATIALKLPLAGVTNYKVRVSGAASTDGPAMTTAFIQPNGFATAGSVPGPAVVSTQPGDGDQDVDIASPIAIVFDQAIAPATLTAQTATGACSGSVQLSADGFTTCVGFSAAAPTMSRGDTVATAQPAAPLTRGTAYKVRVAGTVTTPAGFPAVTVFTQTTGFVTVLPDVPLAVSATQPADGAASVSTLAPIVVTFNQAITASSLTTQTSAGPCSGTLQLSADGFATCVGFVLDSPPLDATSAVATAQPAAALSVQTGYKIRVLAAVTSAQGLPLGADIAQAFGFTTATQLQVSATQPGDGETGVSLNPAIAVTFSEPISPATLTTQTTAGSCTGSLQVSADGFATCVAFTSASPAMSGTNTTATAQLASDLSGQTTYRIRIAATVVSAAAVPLGAGFTQTTGFRTTCAGKLVISQVFGGNNTTGANHFDYVELHNNGRMPVDVKSYVLQLGNPAIATWNAQNLTTATFSTSSIIPPGGYFLIREAISGTDATGADAIPSGTPVNIPTNTAKVVLTHTTAPFSGCPTTDIVDKLGCGTANNQCADGTPTAALGTTAAPLSASRNLGGCQDTDSNAADFTIGTPAPRNSASAIQLCDCPD